MPKAGQQPNAAYSSKLQMKGYCLCHESEFRVLVTLLLLPHSVVYCPRSPVRLVIFHASTSIPVPSRFSCFVAALTAARLRLIIFHLVVSTTSQRLPWPSATGYVVLSSSTAFLCLSWSRNVYQASLPLVFSSAMQHLVSRGTLSSSLITTSLPPLRAGPAKFLPVSREKLQWCLSSSKMFDSRRHLL